VVSRTTEGFDTTGALPGTYQSNQGGTVTLVNPQLELSLRLGGTNTEISSVVVGQPIATVVSTNIPQSSPAGTSDNTLKVKIIDQKTGIKTTAGVTATNIPMWTVSTGPGGLPSGSYTITVMTSETGGAAIDFRSETKDMVVRTQEIDLEAELTEQVSGNDVLITVKAGSGVPVTVALSGATGRFNPNKGDVPTGTLTLAQTIFSRNVPADGTLEAVISSTTTGAVEVRATVTGTTVTDTIDVSFRKPTTTVTVSTTKFTIGDKVTIEGITNSGVDAVAIFVDDVLREVRAVRADDTYKWEWDTGLVATPKPGSLTVKVFDIYPTDNVQAVGTGLSANCGGKGFPAPVSDFFDPEDITLSRPADTSTGLLAVAGDLTATMDTPRVAKEDDVKVTGTAAGESVVRMILVDKDGIPLADTMESVLEDDSFEYTRPTTVSWDSGTYKVLAITDGRDDSTVLTGGGTIQGAGGTTAAGIGGPLLGTSTRLTANGATIAGERVSEMTQSQLIAKITKLTVDTAGSDDKLAVMSFKLEDPSIEITEVGGAPIGIEQISVDVGVAGEEYLTVAGICNRESGTEVLVTASSTEDTKYDLPPVPVVVSEGAFLANLDVSGELSDTYAIKVDDLSKASDELTVNFGAVEKIEEVVEEIVEVVEEILATPEPTPTPTPTPEPTPEPPGFEAIFAIAGLLAVAYLVHRRKN
jgi:PGF-CTERM protein